MLNSQINDSLILIEVEGDEVVNTMTYSANHDGVNRIYQGLLYFNPLNAELNPICHLLALLGAHHILHVSRIRVKNVMQFYTYNTHINRFTFMPATKVSPYLHQFS
jgi:hypothetical protein